MKRITLFLLLLISISYQSFSQTVRDQSSAEAELKSMAATFMDCLLKHDSIKFFNLFNENPVTWVCILDENNPLNPDHKNTLISDASFNEDYKNFYRYISGQGFTEVKFQNTEVKQEDYEASLTFNFRFYKDGKKINWGKQSWGLMYKINTWRITRVIYSFEVEKDNPEPKSASEKDKK